MEHKKARRWPEKPAAGFFYIKKKGGHHGRMV
jgi:hypothetical protein